MRWKPSMLNLLLLLLLSLLIASLGILFPLLVFCSLIFMVSHPPCPPSDLSDNTV
ncbi:hypothetical protein SISSUDRAFT_1050420 [Sistotremastrum suecicum HHB10207 ss-3]|uniref:Uncharacterized protein n=1 Tax=Sistotremastrum suecicum HHB10207 ss-3 TaxID=1314776 RepID=A0A166B6X7_9AGAM|nr:hypothetical protein SISSUDRAFT_1050420 [Sistotremastrum suecicum HHB10207 ss-3]